jgi:hypothetical protein
MKEHPLDNIQARHTVYGFCSGIESSQDRLNGSSFNRERKMETLMRKTV